MKLVKHVGTLGCDGFSILGILSVSRESSPAEQNFVQRPSKISFDT